MKYFLYYFICILFFSYSCHSHSSPEKDEIDRQLQEIKSNTNAPVDSLINIYNNLCHRAEKINYKEGMLECYISLSDLHYRSLEYLPSFSYAKKAEKYALELHDYEKLSDAFRNKGIYYARVGFYELAKSSYFESIDVAKKMEDQNLANYKIAVNYVNISNIFAYTEDVKDADTIKYYCLKTLETAEKISENHKEYLNKKLERLYSGNLMMGMIFLNAGKPDSAENHMFKSLEFIKKIPEPKRKQNDAIFLYCMLGNMYRQKNDYEKALHYSLHALNIESKHKNPYVKQYVLNELGNTYLELGDEKNVKLYINSYKSLNDSLNTVIPRMVDTSVNDMAIEKDSSHKRELNHIFFIELIAFFITSLTVYLLWIRSKIKIKKNYEILIHELREQHKLQSPPVIFSDENSKVGIHQIDIKTDKDANTSTKSISITDDTLSHILKKLDKFENSAKFTRKDLNIASFSHDLNTNTQYLSEIIKKHKGKNFNSYINGLRIGFIINKLYESPVYREYKISYLAEECGFASREVFAMTFRKETGVPPSYFIHNIKKEIDSHNL